MFFNLICSLTLHEKVSDSACKHETLCNHFKTNVFFDDFVFFNQQLQHLLALEVLFLLFQISYLFMEIKLMTLDMLSECSTVEPYNHLPIVWIFFIMSGYYHLSSTFHTSPVMILWVFFFILLMWKVLFPWFLHFETTTMQAFIRSLHIIFFHVVLY